MIYQTGLYTYIKAQCILNYWRPMCKKVYTISDTRFGCKFTFACNFYRYIGDCTMYGPLSVTFNDIWVKVFKNGPSKICGRQPLINLK